MKYITEIILTTAVLNIWLMIHFFMTFRERFNTVKKLQYHEQYVINNICYLIKETIGFDIIVFPAALKLMGIVYGNLLFFIFFLLSLLFHFFIRDCISAQSYFIEKDIYTSVLCIIVSIVKRSILINMAVEAASRVFVDFGQQSYNRVFMLFWVAVLSLLYMSLNEIQNLNSKMDKFLTLIALFFVGSSCYIAHEYGFTAEVNYSNEFLKTGLGLAVIVNVFFANDFDTEAFKSYVSRIKSNFPHDQLLFALSLFFSYLIYLLYGNLMYFIEKTNTAKNIIETILMIFLLFRESSSSTLATRLEEIDINETKLHVRLIVQVFMALMAFGLSIFRFNVVASVAVYMNIFVISKTITRFFSSNVSKRINMLTGIILLLQVVLLALSATQLTDM